jgi:hypothetical protein
LKHAAGHHDADGGIGRPEAGNDRTRQGCKFLPGPLQYPPSGLVALLRGQGYGPGEFSKALIGFRVGDADHVFNAGAPPALNDETEQSASVPLIEFLQGSGDRFSSDPESRTLVGNRRAPAARASALTAVIASIRN